MTTERNATVPSILKRYERELIESLDVGRKSLERLQHSSPSGVGQTTEEAWSTATGTLHVASDILAQMSLEARSTEGDEIERAVADSLVDECRRMVVRFRRDLRALRGSRQRADLMNGSVTVSGSNGTVDEEAGLGDASREQRMGMVGATETLWKASKHLQDSKRSLFETASLGEDILTDLEVQGRTLETNRERLQGTDSRLQAGRGVISSMERTERVRRFILMGIAALGFASIVIIFGRKFWPGHVGVESTLSGVPLAPNATNATHRGLWR